MFCLGSKYVISICLTGPLVSHSKLAALWTKITDDRNPSFCSLPLYFLSLPKFKCELNIYLLSPSH